MKTKTKTEQTTVVTNVEVANNGDIKAETTAANDARSDSNDRFPALKAAEEAAAKRRKFAVAVKIEHAVNEDTIIGKTRKQYVADFNVNLKKSAEGTLQMCRTVYEASKMLTADEFDEFCKNIGYRDSSSTIRKFIAIGKVYPRLISFAHQLPVAWTSIYALTQIAADDFERIIKEGFAFNKLKGAELKELLDKTRDINDVSSPFKRDDKTLTYRAGVFAFTHRIDDRDWRLVEKAFEEIAARLPVKFTLRNDLAELFASRRKATYEQIKHEDKDAAVKPQKWDYGVTANGVVEECVA